MATVQHLKKKLRGINSTRKLSKAMKTASTVKYAKLSDIFSQYSEYEKQCREIYDSFGKELKKSFKKPREDAASCFIIIGSNKGLCGSFNSALCSFAEQTLSEQQGKKEVYLCGRQTELYFTEKGIAYDKAYTFSDVPRLLEAEDLLSAVFLGLSQGAFSSVKLIYMCYENMMNQTPKVIELLADLREQEGDSGILLIPDRQTVIGKTAENVISSIIFRPILETALGAQAATLISMRSAYDTATELCNELEAEINRKRQSRVTADVLETSADHDTETEV